MPDTTPLYGIQFPTPGDEPRRQDLEDLANSTETALASLGPGPQTYTPQLTATTTNPNLGVAGSGRFQLGWWYRTGRLLRVEARIRFGTGSSGGSGTYEVSLPFVPDGAWHSIGALTALVSQIGWGSIRDNSTTSQSRPVTAQAFTTVNPPRVIMLTTTGGNVTHSNPFTWGDLDGISLSLSYLVRP